MKCLDDIIKTDFEIDALSSRPSSRSGQTLIKSMRWCRRLSWARYDKLFMGLQPDRKQIVWNGEQKLANEIVMRHCVLLSLRVYVLMSAILMKWCIDVAIHCTEVKAHCLLSTKKTKQKSSMRNLFVIRSHASITCCMIEVHLALIVANFSLC